MSKKTKLNEQNKIELEAFYKSMKGIIPIKKNNKIILSSTNLTLTPPFSSNDAEKDLEQRSFSFQEKLNLKPVTGKETIAYKKTGVSHQIFRKLRKGHYPVGAVLDLHGLSVEQAKTAVAYFLNKCLQHGTQMVLIIHGKGLNQPMPILKNKLNHWLREIDMVLAFCSASSSHGNRGAIYVLLKNMTTFKNE